MLEQIWKNLAERNPKTTRRKITILTDMIHTLKN